MPSLLTTSNRRKLFACLCGVVVLLALGVLYRAARLSRQVGRGSTFGRVRSLLVRRFGVPEERITSAARLDTDLLREPLDRKELTLVLNEELGLDFPEERVAAAATVGELVILVDSMPRPIH